MVFDLFSSQEEETDDIKSLPLELQLPYSNPYKILGVDRDNINNNTQLIRNSFRKSCLQLISYFSGFNKPKYTAKQYCLAYYICRKILTGPASKLSRELPNLPHLDFRPEDILPLLRPMKSEFPCRREYRGFRMLTISYISYYTVFTYNIIPKIIYQFDVNYMLRRHTLEVDYNQLLLLNNELEKELLTVPEFPNNNNNSNIGNDIANYLMRIHIMLSNMGLFSPRLLIFLDIDFEKIQTEEEGIIISILDTMIKPPSTVWHIIDETWLKKWRKYIMGRGPRRYFPPGPITNDHLINELNNNNKDLQITIDYRCVNYNVWRFYELVHGGGPAITRIDEDIYGRSGQSYLQATIKIQTRFRIFLNNKKKQYLYMKNLSTTSIGKAVIIETALENVTIKANNLLKEYQKKRAIANLSKASIFTQNMWRLKKKYYPIKNLEINKRNQEIFKQSKNIIKDIPKSSDNNSNVINTIQPTIKIGTTNIYKRILYDNDEGIPFKLIKKEGNEDALIHSANDETMFQRRSKIISINNYPTDILTYNEIKDFLRNAKFPLTLELERPLHRELVPKLEDIALITDPILQYNTLKIMLYNGIFLIKHNSNNKNKLLNNNNKHLCKIKINDKNFYYTSKYTNKKDEDQIWNSIYLYQLRFILRGNESNTIKNRLNINNKYSFEIIFDNRGIIFELPTYKQLKKLLLYEKKLKLKQIKKDQQYNELHHIKYDINNLISPEFSNENDIIGDNIETEEGEIIRDLEKRKQDSSTLSSKKFRSFYVPGFSSKKDTNKVNTIDNNNNNKDVDQHKVLCDVLYNGLMKLVAEVRESQLFIDQAGRPIRRNKPKVSLMKYEG